MSDTAIPAEPVTTVEGFTASLAAVQERINAAAQRAGRDPNEVRLLPVTKTVSEDRLRNAVEAGIGWLGENKVQEAVTKHAAMKDLDVKWSVIGPLQSNKTRDVAEMADEFHALDRIRIARRLDTQVRENNRTLDVFVQVNVSGEDTKSGLAPEEVIPFLKELKEFDALRIQGLMTMAQNTDDEAVIRKDYQQLAALRDQALAEEGELLGPGLLSMGMSGDFEIAIEEGANIVRVGQAIFGARDYSK